MRARYRPSPAHVVTVLLGITAMVVTLVLTRDERPRLEIAVATRSVAAGSEVVPEDLERVSVVIEGIETSSFILYDEALGSIGDSILVRSVAAGEPLLTTDLIVVGNGSGRLVSLPIDPERALSGSLRFGDVVDILRADDTGQSEVIASGVRVAATSNPDTLDGYSITLDVADGDVLALVAAAERGEIYAVRSGSSDPLAQTVFAPAQTVGAE
ncbi:MAG: hypothetical protein GEU79_09195 [Acidimicrobiia bacterium]|nr:hypothetical protein [Acidimicrobiia bacterium]